MRLRHAPGGVSDDFLNAFLPVLLSRLHQYSAPMVNYGIDRYTYKLLYLRISWNFIKT